jgi:dihydrodipicolinate synthase/N-acetylneuraminate lyase
MQNYTKNEAKEWARSFLVGQWSTLVTPFDENGLIDEKGLRNNIEYIKSLGTNGAGCSWGMGEFWSLSTKERKRLMSIVKDQAKDWPVAAHISHTSVSDIIELMDHAKFLNYELLIIGAPYFATRKPAQVVEFVKHISQYTDLAIMYYNSPQFGTVLDSNDLNNIVQIENVVGVKEASFNKEISIASHLDLGNKAIISTPDEWIFWEGDKKGFQQQVMFANTSDWRFDTPDNNSYVKFINKATKGIIDNNLYESEIRNIKNISDKWWGKTISDAGGVLPVALCKYWGELVGMSSGGPRLPVIDLSDDNKKELKAELIDLGKLNISLEV